MSNNHNGKKRSGRSPIRINIDPVNGIDVNHCKNPLCANFNVPYTGESDDPNYKRSGTTKAVLPYGYKTLKGIESHPSLGTKSVPLYAQCLSCDDTFPLKSNHGINEALKALTYHPDQTSCPNLDCDNHEVPIGTKLAYQKNGKTPAGTTRWRCNECGKSFVEKAAIRAPRENEKPYRYEDVIRAINNSVPFNRMVELYNVNTATIYHYVEKAYKACLRFNESRNNRLASVLSNRKIVYLATDRQDILVNWSSRKDRNAIPIKLACTSDAETGFVYRYDANIDHISNAKIVHEESIENGDVDVANILRTYPHLFLPSDLGIEKRINGFIEQELLKLKRNNPDITDEELKYEEALLRPNIESPTNHITQGTALPKDFLMIREDYQLYAHYVALRNSVPADVQVINFADQESGLRAGFMSAFADKVLQGNAHLFYITYRKGAVREDREKAIIDTRKRVRKRMKEASCDWDTAVHLLCLDALQQYTTPLGKWRDIWGIHPLESYSEVEKKFSHQTYHPNQNIDDIAHYLSKASLHYVDNNFMRSRRRVSQFERGVPSSASDRRIWYGRSFYRPDMVKKVATIMMTYLNYCKVKDVPITPAQRLGIAKGPVRLKDILLK